MPKYRVESSYDFEDTEEIFHEHLIVVVDRGEEGTESIASFPLESKQDVEVLLQHLNKG